MSDENEFDWEPTPGLPARLPEGEHIVWQGAPHWWQLAQQAFHVRKVAAYFALIIGLDAFSVYQNGLSTQAVLSGPALTLVLSLAALAILSGLAWLSAAATIYTLTNRRVLIRFGIAIQLTLDIPINQIVSADMSLKRKGHGDIAFTLTQKKRASYLVLWPHVRPWRFGQPQPMLRAVANVESLSQQLAEVAQQQLPNGEQLAPTTQAIPSPTAAAHAAAHPTMQTVDASVNAMNKELRAS